MTTPTEDLRALDRLAGALRAARLLAQPPRRLLQPDFPLIYLLVFGTLTHNAHLDTRGGLSMIDFYVPGILTYAIVMIGFNRRAQLRLPADERRVQAHPRRRRCRGARTSPGARLDVVVIVLSVA